MDKKINTVKKVEKPITHFRSLYSINDTKPFTTAEHPFKTPQGWGSIKNIYFMLIAYFPTPGCSWICRYTFKHK